MARWGEKAISAIGMILLAPVAALIALAIVIDDPGPVFARRTGVGRDGRRFPIYGFRTFRVERGAMPGGAPSQHGRRRLTPVGTVLWETRLDEIPMLVNLWRGDLSLLDHDRQIVRMVK